MFGSSFIPTHKPIIAFLAAVLILTAVTSGHAQEPNRQETAVVLASEVDWQKLNPARGDQSPQAGTLWGDRNGTVPTGFLVKFVDGFSSPPHIHNITYRGVVISGLVHNDDPEAAAMWMPKGSYWTQPAGEAHITSAKGSTVAFIEIEKGPYLVKPTDEAFDNGQRPVNVDQSNIVWLDASSTEWIEYSSTGNSPELSFLWGTPGEKETCGTLVKLPPGFEGEIECKESELKAVVIDGDARLARIETSPIDLTPGSYLHAKGDTTLELTCKSENACVLYIRTTGVFGITSGR